MPYRSVSQMRKFFAMESRGDLPEGTAKRWLRETKDVSKLPVRASKRQKLQAIRRRLEARQEREDMDKKRTSAQDIN